MTSSGASPRLLANLLSHEKEYGKALAGVIDAGGAACTALVLCQPWLNQPIQQHTGSEDHQPRSVIQCLALADAGIRTYSAAFNTYMDGLKQLRDLEDSVKNLIRDREILVTRVLKASNKASSRDSTFMSGLSPSQSTASLDSYSGKSYALGGKSNKLPHWQAELQGCEVQLAATQRELDAKRVSAIRDGLRLRALAMVECGNLWAQAGKGILQLSSADGAPLPPLPDFSSLVNKPLPDDASSLTPSQSASQQDVELHIPPAHSVPDMGLPTVSNHVLSRRITEEDLNENASSSSDSEAEVEVVENPRFSAPSPPKSSPTKRFATMGHARTREDSPSRSSSLFGHIRGLFSGKRTSSVNGDVEDDEKPSRHRKSKTWDTSRMDKNTPRPEPNVMPSSPSASVLDVSSPRSRRLRKNSEIQRRRRSASLDGGLPRPPSPARLDSMQTATSTKPSKKKGFGNISRSDSLKSGTSAMSAPATVQRRVVSPPPPMPNNATVHHVPQHQHRRQSSLNNNTPATTKGERRASSPPEAGGSSSLMSIVENVTRANRAATLDADNGRDRAVSSGLVSVKAPHSYNRKEIDRLPMESLLEHGTASRSQAASPKPKQSNGTPPSMYQAKAPTSLSREDLVSLSAASAVVGSTTANPSTSPEPSKTTQQQPIPSSSSSSPQSSSLSSATRPQPLRSALRNGTSRTPSPMSPVARTSSPETKPMVVHSPAPMHAVKAPPPLTIEQSPSPKARSPPPAVSSPPKTLNAPQIEARQPSPASDDDAASMLSFVTSNEQFYDAPDDEDTTPMPTPRAAQPSTPQVVPPTPLAKEGTTDYVTLTPGAAHHVPNGLAEEEHGSRTDISTSTDSTIGGGQTSMQQTPHLPARRKSVRVSLRPTFSPTPPAIEYDEWHRGDTQEGRANGHGKRSWSRGDGEEPPDMWQDSSEEEETAQYSAAKKLLNKVAKKEKKARGG
ncbi:hypothetical protein CYLTODRAFT_390021 [Cylindrobasidium torrendii FP15055 ss-10]|uniref:IMD domain-containing protein n=1 Tax=Cylindrobasidium torrendii FP15055 ss-10 TaxID=1314674 RepID=A0A0D7BM17_9AGAR|nr:hypothetical protein CYLTODRAFT_390021 [Cylindrobasidium torrendii FP15055 ss-10]